ncbi:uncharacterized protein LOC113273076 [Papaver somniferum]|uniref:uncharacterized protein LOC113273076 n=1 Tax=Papaver somniferum TaxID=3469 RepID=UPI000E6F8618|nr:uncharacterized protein LOC113273076 [Papaver somniferum]
MKAAGKEKQLVHKFWQAKSPKTNEEEQKSLNLENKEDNMVDASAERDDAAQLRLQNTIAAKKVLAARTQSAHADHAKFGMNQTSAQSGITQSVSELETEIRVVNKETSEVVGATAREDITRIDSINAEAGMNQNSSAQSGINNTTQSVSDLETQIRVVNKGTSEVVGATASEDITRTDCINAGHAGQTVVDLINLKNTPTDVIDANQLEKELAKSAAELREAQMKFIHCKNNIADQKDIALRKEDMAAQSFSKDEWTQVEGKKPPSKAKTDEEEEKYLNLDNMEDNKVGASAEVCEAHLRLKNAIAAKEALAARTQSAHADHAKVTQVTSNTQIQSEKKQNSEVQSVSESETQTRVVNKQNFVAKSVSKDGILAVNKPKAKEDNARTDSIHAGHADALEVIDEANQLEKELAKSADELREAQMKFIYSKTDEEEEKSLNLDNMEDNTVGASADDTQLKEELDRSESEVREAQLRLQNGIAAKEALAARTQSAHADHAKVTQVTSNTQI